MINRKKFISLMAALVWAGFIANTWAAAWEDLKPGLRLLSLGNDQSEVTVYLLEVNPDQYRFKLLQSRDRGASRLPLRQLVQDADVAAAINASFFDEEGHPMGLVIVDGKEISPLRQTSWGVFQIVSGKPTIIHTRDYKPDPQRILAIQTGPRLVIQGQIPSFKDTSIAPRSAVCITPKQNVILAATPEFRTLHQWAETLKPYCPNALNLDGGSSTQFYVKAKDLTLPGGEPIPNALSVIAK